MYNKKLGAYIAVISHKRPENIEPLKKLLGCNVTVFVNKGEQTAYLEVCSASVVECGTNICEARNRALDCAGKYPCIQISDDLKKIQQIQIVNLKRVVSDVTFETVVTYFVKMMKSLGLRYGGVAITDNRLNYNGENITTDKMIVNDLICVMPGITFDNKMALKEDYDLSLQELITGNGVFRANNILCRFPHRENKGGANTYRNSKTESEATKKLIAKWGMFIKKHPTREGQVLINYKEVAKARAELLRHIKTKK